ncbi:hypothetical protein KJ693_07345 [bacterium]|nr:hypothetical protein [bacterium]MBU1615112.1 hypothetical protein [bacterium]
MLQNMKEFDRINRIELRNLVNLVYPVKKRNLVGLAGGRDDSEGCAQK